MSADKTEKATDKRSTLRTNLLFVLVILLIAAGLLVWRTLSAETGGTAVVDFGYDITETLPLNEDNLYYYDVGEYIVCIQVKDGKAAFIDSQCPDHVCEESFGWLSEVGDWACCMPAGVYLTITE